MTKVEQLTQEVRQLSRAELMAFREWFRTYDAEAWDQQMDADVPSGKLDRRTPDVTKAPERPVNGRGQAMAEALASLAEQGTFDAIIDPVSWQRELRHEPPLPTREP